ncbi:MAG: PAS domain S-box protein [Cyanobacteria bacterium SZAS LIN-2]|nr:PAS domain S-box protein [Cyanobacteria bacterium SZAS LIN-2]
MNQKRPTGQEIDERFHLLLAGVKDYAIIILDESGVVVSWNEGAQYIKGYSAEEIIGKHVSTFYPSEDVAAGKPESELKIAAKDGRFEDEGWRLRKDGSKFYANVVISALVNEEGQFRGFAKVTRDISERKEVERELREAKQRLNLALEAGEVGVWEYDLVNEKIWRSAKLNELLGFQTPANDWHSDSFLTFVAPEHKGYAERMFEGALETGHFSIECKIVRTDKATRWISARGETVKNALGEPIRMVGTIVDITDRIERKDQEKLLAVMKEREEFIATLTHDMKNPLIGANRVLEMLVTEKCGRLTQQQAELLGCLKDSNLSLLNLIRNVVDVYRYEKDSNALVLEHTDLIELVTSSVQRINPIAQLRGIQVTTELPDQINEALFDSNAMSRVMHNLLDNALKFAPDMGNVRVRLFCQGIESIVEIEDDGPGITPEERSQLFQRFSQGEAGRKYAGGSGLGLYLCKQIIEAHGGKIAILDNQKEKGTIFQFRMPLQNPAEHSSAA